MKGVDIKRQVSCLEKVETEGFHIILYSLYLGGISVWHLKIVLLLWMAQL